VGDTDLAQRIETIRVTLEHVNVAVKNIEESVRFLRTAFPSFVVRGEGVTDGSRWLHVGTDQTYIALNESPHDRTARGPLNHLGSVVDDAGAVGARLREAGFKEGMTGPPHPHRRRIYFFDADGIEYEFVQYLSDDANERNDYSQ
jgi:catechol 2,3-dioxygenase-like lactoylglutathione lyase family enzyme